MDPAVLPGPRATKSQLYRMDTRTQTIQMIPVVNHGASQGDAHDPRVSADGRYVYFRSNAKDLVPGPEVDQFSGDLLYRFDSESRKIELLSSADGSGSSTLAMIYDYEIDSSGNRVLISTTSCVIFGAENCPTTGGDFKFNYLQLFLRDLLSRQTRLVSSLDGTSNSAGTHNSSAQGASIVGDLVAFVTHARNFSPKLDQAEFRLVVKNLKSGTFDWIWPNAKTASLTQDQNTIFFVAPPEANDRVLEHQQVWRMNLNPPGQRELVSTATFNSNEEF